MRDECAIKKWVQFSIEGMVKQAVPHGCLMDITRLRVRDIESMILRMAVSASNEIVMERKNVRHQVTTELEHVFTHLFTR